MSGQKWNLSKRQKIKPDMKVALCRTCIAYQPDSDGQGNGVCSVSGCTVCECAQGWRP